MLRRLWLGGVLTAGAVAVGALAVALSACGGSSSVNSALQEQADQFLIGEIESDFHESMTKKDIEQMMSLYAPNATVTIGPGKTATGASDIREAWMTTTPFQPETNWVSDHPAYKVRVTIDGDRGTLYFECHYVDVKTRKVAAVTAADMDVQRIDGHWLITRMVGGTTELKT
jgi:ketosteroid isomerase-like protein